jgi:hypothetical protein
MITIVQSLERLSDRDVNPGSRPVAHRVKLTDVEHDNTNGEGYPWHKCQPGELGLTWLLNRDVHAKGENNESEYGPERADEAPAADIRLVRRYLHCRSCFPSV